MILAFTNDLAGRYDAAPAARPASLGRLALGFLRVAARKTDRDSGRTKPTEIDNLSDRVREDAGINRREVPSFRETAERASTGIRLR